MHEVKLTDIKVEFKLLQDEQITPKYIVNAYIEKPSIDNLSNYEGYLFKHKMKQ